MDTKRFLIATLLSVAVLILWQQLFPPPEPEPAPEVEPIETVAEPEPSLPPPVAGEPAAAEPPAGVVAPTPERPAPEPTAAVSETRVTLEDEDFEAVFTNRGGRLVSLLLKHHASATGEPVDLVRQRDAGPYPLSVTGRGGEPAALDEALYEVRRERTPDGPALEFRHVGTAGEASKRFTLLGGGVVRVEVELPGRTDWGLLLGPGIRNPSSDEVSSRFLRRTVIYRLGDETERITADKEDEPIPVPAGGLRWVGVQDTYFLSALIPSGGIDQILVRPRIQRPDGAFRDPGEGAEEEGESPELALVVQPSAPRLVADTYWGAKEYDRVRALGIGLEQTVELGWFRFLSLPLLRALRWLYDNVVANFGWAIIILTLGIRIVLFPLMHKSTVSMQKMQEVNPKVQAIRQKYRSKLKDKQGRPNTEAQRKMNEEVMALYKSEGVNPAGGCLPLLLQMPVLFAFYSLLSSAIELRQAPWLLWIHDLSAPDPFYVLPIIMGASQFLQQRLTPSAADPMQRRIFQLMPVFFTILFLGFPSGLVLYWLTNNLLGIAQTWGYQKLKKSPAPAAAGAKGKPKRQGGKGR